jgi:predicted histone-like DNA-binding protein
MSVKYKARAKGQPGVAGGGQSKYYATIVRGEKIDFRDLLAEIEELNVVHPGVFLAVQETFFRKVNHHLINGRAVDLGQLGTFYPSIRSLSAENPEDIANTNIRRFKVIFRPSTLLQKGLDRVEFQKLNYGTTTEEQL